MNIPTKEQIENAEDLLERGCLGLSGVQHEETETCLFAIRALRLLMDEPSEEMIKVGVKSAFQSMFGQSIEMQKAGMVGHVTITCVQDFKAMRDALLEMARVG